MSKPVSVLLVDYPIAPQYLYDEKAKEIMYLKKAIEFYLDYKGGRNMLERKTKKSYTLGLLTMGSFLKKHGIEVEYISHPFEQGDLFQKIKGKQFAVFTAMTPIYPYVRKIIQSVKLHSPEVQMVLGGYHASALPAEILLEEPCLDFVVVGEGEKPLLNLVQGVMPTRDIAGLVSRENLTVAKNIKYDLLDASKIPNPDYSLLPGDKTSYRFNIQNTRGCPERCLYCQNGFFWKKVRARPIANIIKELKEIESYFSPMFEIHITDNIFSLNSAFLKGLSEAYDQHEITLQFSCDLKAEYIDEEKVKLMEKINVKKAWMGFEDSSDSILKSAGRRNTFENNVKALQTIKKFSNIKVQGYWMLGLPGTNKDSVDYNIECIRYLLEHDLIEGISSDTLFVPLPGTPLFHMAERFGIRIIDSDWKNYHRSQFLSVFETSTLTQKELRDLIIYFEESVIGLQLAKHNKTKEEVIENYERLLAETIMDEGVIAEKRIF